MTYIRTATIASSTSYSVSETPVYSITGSLQKERCLSRGSSTDEKEVQPDRLNLIRVWQTVLGVFSLALSSE